MSNNPVVANFGIADSSSREKDSREPDEQVLRFFAFSNDLKLESYNDVLSIFLDDFMEQNSDASEELINELRTKFVNALNRCQLVFGNDVFVDTTRERPRQGMIHYDLLMSTVGLLDDTIIESSKDQIKSAYQQLCSSDPFRKALSGGLQKKSSILRRRALWEPLLNGAIS